MHWEAKKIVWLALFYETFPLLWQSGTEPAISPRQRHLYSFQQVRWLTTHLLSHLPSHSCHALILQKKGKSLTNSGFCCNDFHLMISNYSLFNSRQIIHCPREKKALCHQASNSQQGPVLYLSMYLSVIYLISFNHLCISTLEFRSQIVVDAFI